MIRPSACGKFLFAGKQKLWVKGVTYGTFGSNLEGDLFPSPARVEQDFSQMSSNGINAVRTYTPPPGWLLDLAQRFGLYVMVGLPWQQHTTFLDDRELAQRIVTDVGDVVRGLGGHPAVLCYSVGNEIPSSIVRWHGARRIERFIRRLYNAVKAVDPAALVTYVNYPTTEYLRLPFLDLCCFNVYLESRQRLDAYLARLQNLAAERPLIMAEIGLDSRRHGEEAQAEAMQWQLRSAFSAGCAGTFAFAWTDEWHRGGHAVEDWDFGLTNRERQAKPALASLRAVYAEIPFADDTQWPRISVVVCSYNGANTIRDTLEGLKGLAYDDFEIIVVDDGSTDSTAAIAGEYEVQLISTENRGLSNARNTGWQAAGGEIVAYIDDDAYPDPHWLQYLAYTFMSTDYVAVGGPNIAPPGDGPIADCVANAPGGPVHVLLSDREAEHIPGCNMAFRRTALAAIDGFDPRYRAAGDDVDVCWRLQAQGWKIGFHAAAMDWHHRRNSIKMYWKQQLGYGKAEALLEEKWPHKTNAAGHFSWSGRLYGKGLTEALPGAKPRLYQGTWGSAPFQSIYQPAVGFWRSLPLMPEWYLGIAVLAVLCVLGFVWDIFLWAVPMLAVAVALPVIQAVMSAMKAEFPTERPRAAQRIGLRLLTAALHLIQPPARLIGRLRHGLTLWRGRLPDAPMSWPGPRTEAIWSESWRSPEQWLGDIEGRMLAQDLAVRRGGDYDPWDLALRGGLLGTARLLMAVEEHGEGKQQVRFRVWPRCSRVGLAVVGSFTMLTMVSVLFGPWTLSVLCGLVGVALVVRMLRECAGAQAAMFKYLPE